MSLERSGFFDAYLVGEDYDRVYLAQHFAAYFASFINNGVFAEHADQLQVMAMATPQMQVTVRKGQGWINGYWYENTDELYLPIEVADGVLHRIDSIVLKYGTAERNMWCEVKKGVPAVSNPVAPELIRNADYYELQLATVSIPASSINITQSQITDTRLNTEVCGWVTGVVDQIDTTTLFAQFETYFQEFKDFYEFEYSQWTEQQKAAYVTWITGQEADMENWTEEQMAEYDTWYNTHTTLWQTQFETWFEEVKGQLSEDVAGQLQREIDALGNKMEGYTNTITTFAADGSTISQLLEDGDTLVTTFVDKYTILQEWFNTEGIKVKVKSVTFSQDGLTITEQKEVI